MDKALPVPPVMHRSGSRPAQAWSAMGTGAIPFRPLRAGERRSERPALFSGRSERRSRCGQGGLTLALLMLGIFADNHHAALALDDLALFADGLHRRTDFHRCYLLKGINSCCAT